MPGPEPAHDHDRRGVLHEQGDRDRQPVHRAEVGQLAAGHGHHAVAGQMAQEVFRAAADPKMFPEQIRAGLRPWAALTMYARVPIGGVS